MMNPGDDRMDLVPLFAAALASTGIDPGLLIPPPAETPPCFDDAAWEQPTVAIREGAAGRLLLPLPPRDAGEQPTKVIADPLLALALP
jgi:hypothetical protein